MTDNDIIKALECCANCEDCFYGITSCPLGEEVECRSLLAQNAVDLITRQQAELENLKVKNQSLRGAANSLKMHYEEAQAEIKGLNAKNMLTVSEKNAFRTSFYDVLKQLKTVKTEAYKEFAERLKEKLGDCHIVSDEEYCGFDCGDIHKCIDNLLKAMVGEEK